MLQTDQVSGERLTHPGRSGTRTRTIKPPPQPGWPGLALALLLCIHSLSLAPLNSAPAPSRSLSFNPTQQTLSADISGWTLDQLLEHLATETGWHIYVAPNLSLTVSTRFQQRQPADALNRLLGNLNFAFLPAPNRPTRLLVFRGSAHEATRLISAYPDSPQPPTPNLHNELIVRLKPDSNLDIDELALRLGARVVGRVDELDAYRLQFDDAQSAQTARTQLESETDVASVEDNHWITPPDRLEALNPGLAFPPPQLKARPGLASDQIVVALLDTAVSPSSALLKEFLLPEVRIVDSGEPPSDPLSHGTAMAETLLRALASVSTDPAGSPVRILPVDIYGGRPLTTTFDVVGGLAAAAREGAQLINLSLGSDGPSPLMEQTLLSLRDQGVLIIAAAGNQPTTQPVYPAAYTDVLAVTAASRQGEIAPYANRGAFIDLLAPGTSIVQVNQQAFVGTGTSYATAYISGVAAGYLARPNTTPATVTSALRQEYGFTLPGPTTP
jgi:subtilisin family serine protease